jgi:shikimate kinase
MSASRARPLALVGLMGAGKSAVARILGERLGVAVADLDGYLEAEEGCTIAELFEREGEAYFRRREGEVPRQALDAGAYVIACGGGVVLDPAHRALLRERCEVVWLEVSPGEAARRVGGGAGRPLLAGAEPLARLEALLAERAPLYAAVADRRVDTGALTAEAVADAILAPRSSSSAGHAGA